MSTLTCPKCGNEMRTYERNGVTVDQCTGCGGLFLDRGELEQLVAAENSWHSGAAAQAQAPAPPPSAPYVQGSYPGNYDDHHSGHHGDHHSGHHGGYRSGYDQSGYGYGKRRKRSFLSELFDD